MGAILWVRVPPLVERSERSATSQEAQSLVALSRRWWHNGLSAVHRVLTIVYFDCLGMPSLS
ncbi:hypothetical protein D9M68_511430 [compost metagenome]